jgi:hypothetical protein
MGHLLSACLKLATSSRWASTKSGSYSIYKTILPLYRYVSPYNDATTATATDATTGYAGTHAAVAVTCVSAVTNTITATAFSYH